MKLYYTINTISISNCILSIISYHIISYNIISYPYHISNHILYLHMEPVNVQIAQTADSGSSFGKILIHYFGISGTTFRHFLMMFLCPEPKLQSYSGWWLNQPIGKICSSNWIISPGKDENKTCLKRPPRYSSNCV